MTDIGSKGTTFLENISYTQSGILIAFGHWYLLLHMLIKRNLYQGQLNKKNHTVLSV